MFSRKEIDIFSGPLSVVFCWQIWRRFELFSFFVQPDVFYLTVCNLEIKVRRGE